MTRPLEELSVDGSSLELNRSCFRRAGIDDKLAPDMEAAGVELPSLEHREWLLDGLRRLIGLSGWTHFVGCPILRPTNEHFPDRWEQGPRGVRILLRRLLVYAGLGNHRVKLTVYREYNAREFDQHGVGHAGPGTAAWFSGIADDVCQFGVNANELKDTEELVGTLGHEVAHAFRHHHELSVVTSHTEERLTDLTSVYLGFGVFLLNSSFSFKTGGYSASGDRLLYERRERGYLSPPEIALLLGAQLAARGVGRAERRAILAALAPNQAALVEKALSLFEDAKALRERLGVPEPPEWGALPTLEEIAIPLGEDGDDVDDEPAESSPEPVSERKRGRAFRVLGSLSGLGAAAGATAPFLVAMLGLIEGWVLLAAPFGLGVLGWLVGSGFARDECSACGARVARKSESCERCGARFAGSVRSREERLAAEEKLGDSKHEQDLDDEGEASPYRLESRLMTAMYAAWVIRRDLITPESAEDDAELVVRVRCGEFPDAELSELYLERHDSLNAEAQAFFDDYSGGRIPLADQDFSRLIGSVKLTTSEASFRRVAEILDARFDAWQRTHSAGAGSDAAGS
jgi:hypothetical protein